MSNLSLARHARKRWCSSSGMSRRSATSGRWSRARRKTNCATREGHGTGMISIKTVGFIGIGNMGRPMASNLVKGGYQVVAYDADAKRAEQFAKDAGAKAAATLAELGKSVDAIVTMLPTGHEVRACLLESEGGALAASLPKGALVIDMSSADPVGSRQTHADLAKRGLAFVDAPVSGGVPRATDGSLAIMIGGEAEAVAAAKPVLSKMGMRLFDVGGPGNGHAMKAHAHLR